MCHRAIHPSIHPSLWNACFAAERGVPEGTERFSARTNHMTRVTLPQIGTVAEIVTSQFRVACGPERLSFRSKLMVY